MYTEQYFMYVCGTVLYVCMRNITLCMYTEHEFMYVYSTLCMYTEHYFMYVHGTVLYVLVQQMQQQQSALLRFL